MRNLGLLIGLIASFGSSHLYAGSPVNDPIAREIRNQFQKARPLQIKDLHFAQKWDCQFVFALGNDFEVYGYTERFSERAGRLRSERWDFESTYPGAEVKYGFIQNKPGLPDAFGVAVHLRDAGENLVSGKHGYFQAFEDSSGSTQLVGEFGFLYQAAGVCSGWPIPNPVKAIYPLISESKKFWCASEYHRCTLSPQ